MKALIKIYLTVYWLCQSGMQSAPRRARLSLAEENIPTYFLRNIDGSPGTYSFGYDVTDPKTGINQFRSEERYANGTVVGSYGYVDNSGTPQNFRYIADEKGYRVFKDIPKVFGNPPLIPPARKPDDQSMESSVTWTRPKKPNKKKPNDKVNQTEVDKLDYVNREINYIKPPSYYVEYEK